MTDLKIKHTTLHRLVDYSNHLKNLNDVDKHARFGYIAKDFAIDQMALHMAYNPKIHELWYARVDGEIAGWGHLANIKDTTWELAVSVEEDHQRKGVGDALIKTMLAWAKFHNITEVFMHCIEKNRVIQHLASKNSLEIRARDSGEWTSSITLPKPTIFETNSQLWREQTEILREFNVLKNRMMNLWSSTIHQVQ